MILWIFNLTLQLTNLNPEYSVQNRDFWISELRNSSSDLRITAAQKLGELRYSEAIAPIANLSQDPVPEVRFAAIRALSRYLSQEALDALNTSFAAEADPYLKAEVRRSKKSIEDFLKAEAAKTSPAQTND